MNIVLPAARPIALPEGLLQEVNYCLDRVCEAANQAQESGRTSLLMPVISMHDLTDLFLSIDKPSRESGQREFYHTVRRAIYAATWRHPQILRAQELSAKVDQICQRHQSELKVDIAGAKKQGVHLLQIGEQRLDIALTMGAVLNVNLLLGRIQRQDAPQLQAIYRLVKQAGRGPQRRWQDISRKIEEHFLKPFDM